MVTAARVRARGRARGRRPVDRPAREGLRLILSPPVLSATIVINLLSLALPVVLLQVYDRVIPNQSVDTLALLVVGLGLAFGLDARPHLLLLGAFLSGAVPVAAIGASAGLRQAGE